MPRPSGLRSATPPKSCLVHEKIAADYIARIAKKLLDLGVELRGTKPPGNSLPRSPSLPRKKKTGARSISGSASRSASCRASTRAIRHINRYSTKNSDAIVTENEANARRFLREVDSATVYWNASTRFSDGGEFGFGAEMGISTQKLHCRGPFALAELTSSKYEVFGTGQVRE